MAKAKSPPRQPLLVDATCHIPLCQHKTGLGTYQLMGYCANCHSRDIIGTFTQQHAAIDGEDSGLRCPYCGCRTLSWKHRPEEDD